MFLRTPEKALFMLHCIFQSDCEYYWHKHNISVFICSIMKGKDHLIMGSDYLSVIVAQYKLQHLYSYQSI